MKSEDFMSNDPFSATRLRKEKKIHTPWPGLAGNLPMESDGRIVRATPGDVSLLRRNTEKADPGPYPVRGLMINR